MTTEHSTAAHSALDAQYEILRELGRGGTAVVYLARERATGDEVAIKLIRAKFVEDDEAVARFAREARFISQLAHPNVVPVRAVLDLGSAGLALVMAHLPGRTLREVLRVDGPLSPEQTDRVLRDMASALGAAHAMGIVHRDVKPENIFIESDGRAVLADFGLARSMTADTQVTMMGVAIGTPAYMSPEQIDGVELDARADVYSLGLVGWEMLTGRRPWDGHSLYAILYSQKHDRLPDPRDLREDVGDRLAEVILRAMAKDRGMRWQSMRELSDALDAPDDLGVSPRQGYVSADTTRFVRPVMPAVAEPLHAMQQIHIPEPAYPLEPIRASVPDKPWDQAAVLAEIQAFTEPRRRVMSRRTVSIAAGVIVIAAGGVFVRGQFDKSSRTPDTRTFQPVQAGDVAKPVVLSAPVKQTAPPKPDTTHVVSPPPTPATTTSHSAPEPAQTAPAQTAPAQTTPARPARVVDSATTGTTEPGLAIRALPGLNTTVPHVDAIGPASASTGMKSRIVVGGMHTCLIGTDDHVSCWGGNDRGQLGGGNSSRAASPVPIGGDARYAMVATGLSHTCALTRSGAAWCWGSNDHGQLGDRTFAGRLTPVRAAEDHGFESITAGAEHTCGLDGNGFAWCWGSNAHGQLGSGASPDSSTRNIATAVAVGRASMRFTSIAAGWSFTCGIGSGGRGWCWGANASGQLGDGSMVDRFAPAPVESDESFAFITAGSTHACGVTVQGDAYCWGRNANGQLGDGTTTDRSKPTRVRSNAHFVSITAGAVHTCAVANTGETYCWGRNTYGQLGTGTVADAWQPVSIGDGYAFVAVRAFGSHTCGMTASGTAFCWGYNADGQLGDGTRIDRARPVRVLGPGGG